MADAKNVVKEILKKAGITINGKRDFDIQVHNDLFYQRALAQGVLGFGESYMDGWWDVKRLDLFAEQLVRKKLNHKATLSIILLHLKSTLLNMQDLVKSKKVAEVHYNLSNDLYSSFLDPLMQYSCGYFKGPNERFKR